MSKSSGESNDKQEKTNAAELLKSAIQKGTTIEQKMVVVTEGTKVVFSEKDKSKKDE